MKHVVMFSGGVTSWAAAKRVAALHGTDLVLLFTDTNIEDEDLYRFLKEGAGNVGGELVWLDNDGKTPFDVFRDVRMLGNNRIAPCSRVLKQEPARRWVEDNCDPVDTTVHVGIDWTELHRLDKVQHGWDPWPVDAPMTWRPLIDKQQVFDWLESEGIARPRLYDLGMPHNNCGGGCVRAGQRQWKQLHYAMPERFDWWAEQEQGIREHLDADVSILRDRRGGPVTPLPLYELKRREDEQPSLLADDDSWGGCGCFIDGEE